MQIKIVDRYTDSSARITTVELHGPNSYLAGWEEKVLHPSTKTLKQCVPLKIADRMCQAAFDAGYDEALKQIRKALGINK